MVTDLGCQIGKHFVHVTDPRVDRGTNLSLGPKPRLGNERPMWLIAPLSGRQVGVGVVLWSTF